MSFKPMVPSDVDVSKIEFASLKKLDNGANIMYLNYESKPIYMKTPELDVPFDCQYWPDSGDNSGKWAVKVNLTGKGSEDMIRVLREMDNRVKEEAMKNSVAWFKKRNLSMDTIETLYTPQVKESLDSETGEPNGKYPPGFAFKIVKRDGKVTCGVYGDKKMVYNVNDESKDDFMNPTDLLKKGSKVKLLIRCNGLWIANGKFGCTWRAEQVKVTPAENFDECVFGDSDDEDVEEIDGNFVESDDEDEKSGGSDGSDGSGGDGGDGDEEDEVKTVVKKPRKVRKAN